MLRSARNAAWIERHCVVPDGKLGGQRVVLTARQREWLAMIYDTPTRRFILSMARKNAKTAFSAFILLLHLVGPESKQNSEIYSVAMSRAQAAIIFRYACKIIRGSPTLRRFIRIRETAKQLYCEARGTLFTALSSESKTAYGLNPALVIHDELGQVRGPRHELYEAMETAGQAQESPLSVIISTQARTDGDLLSLLIDAAKRGDDPLTKVALYAAPDDADPFSEEALAAANPHMSDFMNVSELRAMAADAKRMPSRENEYRNLVLNQRVNFHSPLVSRAVWNACGAAPDEDVFARAPVYLGVDLSSRQDLTALAMAARDGDGIWHVRTEYWTPANTLEERSRRDKAPYDLWVEQGYMNATPGSTVEYSMVAERIAELCEQYDVRIIACDRWRMDELQALGGTLGFATIMKPFGQGFRDMTPALEYVEASLLDAKVRHGGCPVLRMCAANATVVSNATAQRKLDKLKAAGRIDGMIALVMAMQVGVTDMGQEVFRVDDYIDDRPRGGAGGTLQ
jgi:phage terminase large subunit-like protein